MTDIIIDIENEIKEEKKIQDDFWGEDGNNRYN